MVQSRTTKLSKLLLVMSTVLLMVPLVINSHRRFDGPHPPPPHSMSMSMPHPREGMRHRERSNSLPAGAFDRKVMPMPAQVDDIAVMPRDPNADAHMPPPHRGHGKCAKGMLAALVAITGILAGATESRKAVTVFMVVLALCAVTSTTMTIVGAHHKVHACRASQSITALGRDFHPEVPQRELPRPGQIANQAGAVNMINADVQVSMDGEAGANQIVPRNGAEIVEVEEIDIEVQIGDGAAEAMPNHRAAKALHKRGHWGHGPRRNAPRHGHGHGHGSDDCERAVKGRVAHKVGINLLAAIVFFVIARLLRKSIVADEAAVVGVECAAVTTKCDGGAIYEGVPVKCAADDVVV